MTTGKDDGVPVLEPAVRPRVRSRAIAISVGGRGRAARPRQRTACRGDSGVLDGVADRHLIDIFAAIVPFERG